MSTRPLLGGGAWKQSYKWPHTINVSERGGLIFECGYTIRRLQYKHIYPHCAQKDDIDWRCVELNCSSPLLPSHARTTYTHTTHTHAHTYTHTYITHTHTHTHDRSMTASRQCEATFDLEIKQEVSESGMQYFRSHSLGSLQYTCSIIIIAAQAYIWAF